MQLILSALYLQGTTSCTDLCCTRSTAVGSKYRTQISLRDKPSKCRRMFLILVTLFLMLLLRNMTLKVEWAEILLANISTVPMKLDMNSPIKILFASFRPQEILNSRKHIFPARSARLCALQIWSGPEPGGVCTLI